MSRIHTLPNFDVPLRECSPVPLADLVGGELTEPSQKGPLGLYVATAIDNSADLDFGVLKMYIPAVWSMTDTSGRTHLRALSSGGLTSLIQPLAEQLTWILRTVKPTVVETGTEEGGAQVSTPLPPGTDWRVSPASKAWQYFIDSAKFSDLQVVGKEWPSTTSVEQVRNACDPFGNWDIVVPKEDGEGSSEKVVVLKLITYPSISSVEHIGRDSAACTQEE